MWCCTGKAQEHMHNPVLSPSDTLTAHFLCCPKAQLLSDQWYLKLTEMPEGCTPNPLPLPRAESDTSPSHLLCGEGCWTEGPGCTSVHGGVLPH